MTDAPAYPQPTLDFRGDPARVKWTKRVEDSCAYCGGPIPEEAAPLHLSRQDGTGARFCDPCAEICFWPIEEPGTIAAIWDPKRRMLLDPEDDGRNRPP
jgi:ribosomal protein L24E